MKKDKIVVEILEDGTCKATTDDSISDANHAIAERLLTVMAEELGGESVRTKTKPHHHHHHNRQHHTHKA